MIGEILSGFRCSECGEFWLVSSAPGEDGVEASARLEADHALTGCPGSIGPDAGGIGADASRVKTEASRWSRFLTQASEEIARAASDGGLSTLEAAAVLFARHEREAERRELGAPPAYMIGLGTTTVPGLSSANIMVQHYCAPLRLREISVPRKVAESFFLTDIKIGKISQFASPGAVPMTFFSDERWSRPAISADTPWQLAMMLTLSVTNVTDRSAAFRGTLLATTWDSKPAGASIADGLLRDFLRLGEDD